MDDTPQRAAGILSFSDGKMPENNIEIRPLNLPRDGFSLMDKEGSFSKKIDSIIKMAEVKGLWREPEDIPIVLTDHLFWAYWLYKTANPNLSNPADFIAGCYVTAWIR